MIITGHKNNNAEAAARNDDSDLHEDEVGENTGDDSGLATKLREEKIKPDSTSEKSPKGENL